MTIKDLKKIDLHAGIHTLEANGIDPNCSHVGIEIQGANIRHENEPPSVYAKINPNKYFLNGDQYIESYADMKKALKIIEKQCCVKELTLNRIDFRIDDYINPYQQYEKLNRLAFILLAKECNLNTFDNKNHITHKAKGHIAVGQGKQIQVYDRTEKNKTEGLTKGRFEVRSIFNRKYPKTIDEIPNIVETWIDSILQSQNHYKIVTALHNEALLQKWEQERHTEIKTFIRFSHDDIFSRQQLNDLLEKLPTRNVKSLSYDCTRDIEINFISSDILGKYTTMLAKALYSFMNNRERNVDFADNHAEISINNPLFADIANTLPF